MHRRIVGILRSLKRDPARLLDRPAITDICRRAGHSWRATLLDPVATIHVFLIQVLHGNTAINHLPRLTRRSFTDSAYCQARTRLPLEVFRDLVRRVADSLHVATKQTGRWLGHRVLVIDGSAFSMPDTPELQEHFGQARGQAPGCGFPIAHLLAVFDVGTGMLRDVLAGPLYTHDMADAARLHPRLEPGDVLLGDRGFCSFAHLALLLGRGVDGVFRMHQRQVVDFEPHRPHKRPGQPKAPKGLPSSRWLRGLGVTDQVVAWVKPKARPEWMTGEQYAGLPEELEVRELRYRIDRPGYRARAVTLATTLRDAGRYPVESLAMLYRERWRVELNLRHLKTTMGMDVLRCETVAGVSKELLMFALAYNLVRLVMLEAASRQGVAVERISFVDALRWISEARPGDPVPRLVVNRDRPDRYEPRVRKRRPKSYPLMTKPRSVLRKALAGQELAS
jgi:hypothetical protein